MNIVYIISNMFYQMALVSMTSLFLNSKKNKINLYIVYDEDFDESNFKYFEEIKNFENCEKLNFIKVSGGAQYKNMFCPVKMDERCYVFLLGDLIPQNRVLMLSATALVTDDLSELYNYDLDGISCYAPEYVASAYSHSLLYDVGVKPPILFDCCTTLINLDYWRRENYAQKFKDTVIKDKTNPIHKFMTTMYIFNTLIENKKNLSLKYNFAEAAHVKISDLDFGTLQSKTEYMKFLTHKQLPAVCVFFGVIPTSDNPALGSYKSLWWQYAEKSCIYDEIKDYKDSNEYKLKATSASNSFDYMWLLSRMWPYIKPYMGRIAIGFAISVPLGLLDGVTALALKPYMDYVIGGKAFEFSLFGQDIVITSLMMAFILPVGIILFAALQGVLRYLNSYISSWTSMKITNSVKVDLFHQLIHMHPQFFDDNPSGIVISRYVGDPQTASAGIVDKIKTITTSAFGALGLIAVMLYSSWQLAFIGVLVLCVAFIPVTLLRNCLRAASNKNMIISGNITTNMNETYNGNKVMYAYDLQDVRENDYREQIRQSFDVNISLTKRTAWMSPMMYQIASIGIAIVLGYGTYLINKGSMTAGAFASFVTSLLLLYKPVKSLGSTLTGIQNIFVAMGRVFELFDLQPQIKDCENPVELKTLNDNVTFENVCFEYVPNKPVLKNINIVVPKNETLAIVGNSGGGKSTLVNLINRFYEVKSGAVKIDGIDIRKYSLKSLRGAISTVFQDNFLYSGTIKDNILMGKPDATPEELDAAISYAHLDEMITKLPEGIETVIGERGLTLSGGQRQRVAIARAMLRNAPIVILDEATSALDNESEAIVQKAMDNLMKNRTVFIIAHRLSTIKNADRIAVINEGELVELGTHEELMSIENGQYKHLYEMQFKHQEEAKAVVV